MCPMCNQKKTIVYFYEKKNLLVGKGLRMCIQFSIE